VPNLTVASGTIILGTDTSIARLSTGVVTLGNGIVGNTNGQLSLFAGSSAVGVPINTTGALLVKDNNASVPGILAYGSTTAAVHLATFNNGIGGGNTAGVYASAIQTTQVLITLGVAAVAGNLVQNTTPASELQLYNTAVGTVSSTNASPAQAFAANYWATGGVTGLDYWTIQSSLTAGLNGASTLTFAHTGSTGSAAVQVPLLDIGGTDTGISRLAGASLAIGNGTAGDFSGSLKLAELILPDGSTTTPPLQFNNAGANAIGIYCVSNTAMYLQVNGNPRGVVLASGMGVGTTVFGFSSAITSAFDTGISRLGAAGIIGVGNGTAGNSSGTLLASIYGFGATTSATSADTGISRLAGGSLAIGNGTASDTTGNLSLNQIIKYAGVATVKAGVGSIVASTVVTGKTAAITATTIYAVPSSGAGMYRVSWTAWITTAAAASSTLGGTNGFQTVSTVGGVAVTDSPTTPTISALNTTATKISGVLICQCDASTALQYAFGYTDATAVMTYSLNAYVEFLG